jgi:hypothetical protein
LEGRPAAADRPAAEAVDRNAAFAADAIVINVALNGRHLDGTQRKMTRAGALLLVLALCAPAGAQPLDPYGGGSSAAPAARDPVLSEQIAEQLVARAQELIDAKLWVDAKQLAVEALVESPKGNAAERARFIIKTVNAQLGISDETQQPPAPPTPISTEPPTTDNTITDPTTRGEPAVPPPAEGGAHHDGSLAAGIHGGIFAGLIGATIGAAIDADHPEEAAIPVAAIGAVGGGLLGNRLGKRWDEAQVRTVGAGSVWGAVAGAFFAETVQGANDGDVTAPGILLGASIGSTLGAAGGLGLAYKHKLTRGDVALVDTLAGIGAAGGLTLGMLMQPAQDEAYSLNAVLGTGAGIVVGLVAAPQTNTTPRRMLRVAGLAVAGGALPFLLYAGISDSSSSADERVTGLLSTAGLVGGAWLGFHLTRHMDEGLDVPDGEAAPTQDAPPAVVGRSSDGRWQLGGLGLMTTTVSPQHTPTLSLVGATW